MTKKWTKGNWRVVDEYLEINQLPRTAIMAFEDEAEKNICRLSLRSPEEELANAHLIAAAPDMYGALMALHKVFILDLRTAYTEDQYAALNNALIVLAKAEGGSQ